MVQANPNAGVQQLANYQELYALMPDVLNGQYTMYLAPFCPKESWLPMMFRTCL
jgi:hypothetical protein